MSTSSIYKKIKNIYTFDTFGSRYGISIWLSAAIIIVIVSAILYFNMMNNITHIKNNWVNERCKPHILPVAGMINAPPGTNKTEYTNSNFTGCIQTVLEDIIEFSLTPVYFILDMILIAIDVANEAMQLLRELFSWLRTMFGGIMGKIMAIISAIISFLVNFFLQTKTIMSKARAILIAGADTIISGFDVITTGFWELVWIIVDFTVGLILATIALFVLAFFFPAWSIFADIFFGLCVVAVALIVVYIVFVGDLIQYADDGSKNIPSAPKAKK